MQIPLKNERLVEAPMMKRAAETMPSSYRDEDNSIEIVFSTGAAVTRFDWWDGEYYDETLSLDPGAVRLERLNAGAVFLDSHSAYSLASVIGSVEPGSARIEGGKALARVRLSRSEDVASQVSKILEGHVRSGSVGYAVHAYEVIEAGSAHGNARKEMRAIDWEPMEISAVAIPADAGSQVRSERSRQGGFPCVIRGVAATKETEIMADPVITPAADPAPPANPAIERRVAPKEAITLAALTARARPMGADFTLAMIERHASTPMTELDLERAINDHYAAQNALPEIDNAITVQRDAGDKYIEGAVHGILARAGLAKTVEDAARLRGEPVKITPGEFRGVRLVTLAAETLARSGVKLQSRNEEHIVETVLRHVQQTRAVITQTTSDFAIILETAMHKAVQAAYMTTPDTWRRWCKTGSVTDFRDFNRYLLGSFGTLDSVNEAGEIKNKSVPDGAREKIRAGTKGNIINLSRNAIINDDLGAFSDMAVQLGRAAKLTIEVDAYSLLNSNPTMADGVALFHASHGNLAGAGAAPSVAAFDAIGAAMAVQKDVSGNEYLDIMPAVLLVPRTLRGTAITINESEYDPDAVNKLQKPNTVRGLFADIVATPRLSGTAYYAFADPQGSPTFEVAFLNGVEEPKVDSQDGWRVLGVEWRVIHDYGVGAVNWRAAYKQPGA